MYIFFVSSNGINRLNRRNNSKCNARKMHSKEEKYIKLLALNPLIKYPIPNQDKIYIGLNKDQYHTPDVPPFLPGNKILLNEGN